MSSPSLTTTAKSLTAEEVKVGAYHEVFLTYATLVFYTPQLAACASSNCSSA